MLLNFGLFFSHIPLKDKDHYKITHFVAKMNIVQENTLLKDDFSSKIIYVYDNYCNKSSLLPTSVYEIFFRFKTL